ncbi:response regulator transcription factor [Leifsonia shinshuensis]|uniref:response regulator transcription factor n=1 Tax=Leifsonia shinshuensis TaxID=150026 RepID=UPI002862E7B1|nr:response regulator transcription factor [Leifsonia shinshuensis]MDR6971062.1 DNA-binding response OmpR family regulator [Leifsonia shinshuensis]
MGDDRGLVLVVEDEPAIAELERMYLADAGFGVHVERDGSRALESVSRLRPAAIVLDIGVPGMDGVEVCRRLRARGDWTPVVFVTARDDEVDRILGLELGADDYVTKPFSPRELVARIRGLIRRAAGSPGAEARRIGPVSLDPARRRVEAGGARVELTATEFDLLEHLMSQPGRVFTREQLLSSVWGVADYSSSRTVDVHVAQLRTKLGDASWIIRTARGVGYSAAGADD